MTQQTIRVPVGYPLPGMQLHVVAGRGATPQYASLPRPAKNYSFSAMDNNGVKFTERGVPEGAASVTQNDCNNGSIVSPTSGQMPPTSNQQSVQTGQQSGAVFYAMNVWHGD